MGYYTEYTLDIKIKESQENTDSAKKIETVLSELMKKEKIIEHLKTVSKGARFGLGK